MPIPRLIFGISWARLKNAEFEVLNIYSLAFLGLQLGPKMPTLRSPKLILGISWVLDQKY